MGIQERRRYLETIETYHATIHEKWGERLERAMEPTALGRRSDEVILAAVGSIVKWSVPVIEEHIEKAFDLGSNVAEILEAMVHISYNEGGSHSLGYGLHALWYVVPRREAAGLPTPRRGALAPEDMHPEAPWPEPPQFPYQTPYPRLQQQALDTYAPDLAKAYRAWTKARFDLREGLTRRMQELLLTAGDAVLRWPAPRIDHHMHAAFEVGCNVQEMIDAIMSCADFVQGAADSNPAGRLVQGGVQIIEYGLAALDRVLTQRDGAGMVTLRDP